MEGVILGKKNIYMLIYNFVYNETCLPNKKCWNTVTCLPLKESDLQTLYLFNYMKNVADPKINKFYHGVAFCNTISVTETCLIQKLPQWQSNLTSVFLFLNFIAVSAERIEGAVRNYQGGGNSENSKIEKL